MEQLANVPGLGLFCFLSVRVAAARNDGIAIPRRRRTISPAVNGRRLTLIG